MPKESPPENAIDYFTQFAQLYWVFAHSDFTDLLQASTLPCSEPGNKVLSFVQSLDKIELKSLTAYVSKLSDKLPMLDLSKLPIVPTLELFKKEADNTLFEKITGSVIQETKNLINDGTCLNRKAALKLTADAIGPSDPLLNQITAALPKQNRLPNAPMQTGKDLTSDQTVQAYIEAGSNAFKNKEYTFAIIQWSYALDIMDSGIIIAATTVSRLKIEAINKLILCCELLTNNFLEEKDFSGALNILFIAMSTLSRRENKESYQDIIQNNLKKMALCYVEFSTKNYNQGTNLNALADGLHAKALYEKVKENDSNFQNKILSLITNSYTALNLTFSKFAAAIKSYILVEPQSNTFQKILLLLENFPKNFSSEVTVSLRELIKALQLVKIEHDIIFDQKQAICQIIEALLEEVHSLQSNQIPDQYLQSLNLSNHETLVASAAASSTSTSSTVQIVPFTTTQVIELLDKDRKTLFILKYHLKAGNEALNNKKYPNAIPELSRALNIMNSRMTLFGRLNTIFQLNECYAQMCFIYKQEKNFSGILEAYFKAIKILSLENSNEKCQSFQQMHLVSVVRTYFHCSQNYYKGGEYEKAIITVLKAKKTFELIKEKDPLQLHHILCLLINSYHKLAKKVYDEKRFAVSFELFAEAISLFLIKSQNKNPSELNRILQAIRNRLERFTDQENRPVFVPTALLEVLERINSKDRIIINQKNHIIRLARLIGLGCPALSTPNHAAASSSSSTTPSPIQKPANISSNHNSHFAVSKKRKDLDSTKDEPLGKRTKHNTPLPK